MKTQLPSNHGLLNTRPDMSHFAGHH